jgi:hypothetical protein
MAPRIDQEGSQSQCHASETQVTPQAIDKALFPMPDDMPVVLFGAGIYFAVPAEF